MLSVVEVYWYIVRDWKSQLKEDNVNLYVTDILPTSSEMDMVDTNNVIGEDCGDGDNFGRAYYKLKEANEMSGDGHGAFHWSFQDALTRLLDDEVSSR